VSVASRQSHPLPGALVPWRRIIARSLEEAEAKHAALIEAGEVARDDNAVYRIITGVPRSQEGIAR
jgi:hypothetical protein